MQRPTIPTPVMLPVLAAVYTGPVRAEEREVVRFGGVWRDYTAATPGVPAQDPASPATIRHLCPCASLAAG